MMSSFTVVGRGPRLARHLDHLLRRLLHLQFISLNNRGPEKHKAQSPFGVSGPCGLSSTTQLPDIRDAERRVALLG